MLLLLLLLHRICRRWLTCRLLLGRLLWWLRWRLLPVPTHIAGRRVGCWCCCLSCRPRTDCTECFLPQAVW